ncbi:MAG TPA: co-chaperone GroES [Candidatus Enteromonas pullicola]|uniref:Co-chaperonin GroES n=1 Tax=Candidatus Alloenteromonas pullicola TaxID=2840784 RepID=A0A9D1LN83_9FIRM|nr:co-chaperone GroES [Candidatus Enteromonas pullicola]
MIKPLSDYVLLEKTPSEKKVGSIILTSEKKVGNVASVVAIGPGKKDEDGKLVPMSVKPGDRVVYREYAGTDIEDEGKKYILLKDEDILATIE